MQISEAEAAGGSHRPLETARGGTRLHISNISGSQDHLHTSTPPLSRPPHPVSPLPAASPSPPSPPSMESWMKKKKKGGKKQPLISSARDRRRRRRGEESGGGDGGGVSRSGGGGVKWSAVGEEEERSGRGEGGLGSEFSSARREFSSVRREFSSVNRAGFSSGKRKGSVALVAYRKVS